MCKPYLANKPKSDSDSDIILTAVTYRFHRRYYKPVTHNLMWGKNPSELQHIYDYVVSLAAGPMDSTQK